MIRFNKARLVGVRLVVLSFVLAAFTGLSEEYLLSVYRRKDNDFAGKLDPAKKNSKIFFDTEKFDQWRAKQIKLEVEAMRRKGCGVA